MDDPASHAWAAITPQDVARLLAALPIRWWIAGGWALDVQGKKPHRDIDVAVLRPEHEALREHLRGWDLRIAYHGELRPWLDGAVGPPENAVWGRPSASVPWHIDFKIETVDGDLWIYRRDKTVTRPLEALGTVIDGIPYLAPDVARLYAKR